MPVQLASMGDVDVFDEREIINVAGVADDRIHKYFSAVVEDGTISGNVFYSRNVDSDFAGGDIIEEDFCLGQKPGIYDLFVQ